MVEGGTDLVHAGVDDPESHVKVRTLRNSQPHRVCSHQAVNTALALRYQGRCHLGGLALLDGDGRLLRGEQPGRPEVVRPHLAVDGARADTVEAALQYGHTVGGLGAGEPLGVAPTDGDWFV